MEKLTIQNIAEHLVEHSGVSKIDFNQFVDVLFEVVQSGLERDQLVKIKGLGTFKIIGVDARESINVNTGERVVIESHSKITFTPDSTMKEIVNKPFSQFDTVVLNDGVDFDELVINKDDSRDADSNDADSNDAESSENECDADDIKTDSKDDISDDDDVKLELNNVLEEAELQTVITGSCLQTLEGHNEPISDSNHQMEADLSSHSHSMKEPENEISTTTEQKETTVVQSEPNKEVIEENVQQNELVDSDTDTNAEISTDSDTNADMPTDADVNTDITTDANTVTVSDSVLDVQQVQKNKSSSKHVFLFLLFAIILIIGAYFGGYKCGELYALRESNEATKDVKPLINKNPKTAHRQKVMSKSSSQTSSVSSPSSVPVSAKVTTEVAPQKVNESVKNQEDENWQKYDKIDIRLKTGAYGIVGTEKTVQVKAGETLSSLSRRALGPDMECYIEVYNSLSSNSQLTAGQRLKIPKLELKRRLRKNVE